MGSGDIQSSAHQGPEQPSLISLALSRGHETWRLEVGNPNLNYPMVLLCKPCNSFLSQHAGSTFLDACRGLSLSERDFFSMKGLV